MSVFLIEDGTSYRDALRRPDELAPFDLGPGLEGRLFMGTPVSRPPAWLEFLAQLARDPLPAVESQHVSAVLFLTRDTHTFAITFGFGRHLLKPEAIVADYGLKVAAGLVDPNEISSLDSRSFEATVLQVRRQTNRGTTSGAIGYDVGREMLNALAGRTADSSVGTRIAGSASVGLSAPVTPSDLGGRMDRLYAAYEGEDYRRGAFRHIDRWTRMKATDQETLELNRELLVALQTRWAPLHEGLTPELNPEAFASGPQMPALAAPEVIDYGSAGFRAEIEPAGTLHPFPDLDAYLIAARRAPRIEDIKQTHIEVVAADSGGAAHSWPILRCLTWERNRDGETYLLSDGAWWRISTDYRQEVNEAALRIRTSTLAAPPFDPDEWEVDYNVRLRDEDADNRVLLDRENARFKHESGPVEPCDVLTADGHFVHVKVAWEGSATLSHLFAQGLVSARLLVRSSEFRAHLQSYVAQIPGHAVLRTGAKPDPREYKIVYAIITTAEQPDATSLPFFARNHLVQVAPSLADMGYEVEVCFIPVVSNSRPVRYGESTKQANRRKLEAASRHRAR